MAINRILGGGLFALLVIALIAHAVDYPMTPKANIDMQDHEIQNVSTMYVDVLNVSNSTNMPINWTMLQNFPPCSSTGYAITCLGDSLTSTYFGLDGATFMEDFNAMGYSLFNLTNVTADILTDGTMQCTGGDCIDIDDLNATESYLTRLVTSFIQLSGMFETDVDVGGNNIDNATNITVTGNFKVNEYILNSSHIPDHNGHSISKTFEHIINRGKASAVTVALTGGLGINWTAGEIYDTSTDTFIKTTAGSGNLNDNVVNYLKWVSGTGLTITTSSSSSNEIQIATFSTYAGVINTFREHSLISESIADTRRGLRIAFPIRIISGMAVTEDANVTYDLDVSMSAGEAIKDGIERKTPSAIDSRTTPLIRHFHTGGVWDYDTNVEISTTHYDDGNNLVAIPGNKWAKAYFIFMNGKLGFIFPNEYFNNEAQAQDAALPAIPPGLSLIPKLTAIVYKSSVSDFNEVTWQDIRPGISEESFNIVTDHGALAGLGDDDHPQYLLVDGTRNMTGTLVMSDAGAQVNTTMISSGGNVGCCGMNDDYSLSCTAGAC